MFADAVRSAPRARAQRAIWGRGPACSGARVGSGLLPSRVPFVVEPKSVLLLYTPLVLDVNAVENFFRLGAYKPSRKNAESVCGETLRPTRGALFAHALRIAFKKLS